MTSYSATFRGKNNFHRSIPPTFIIIKNMEFGAWAQRTAL